MFQTSNLITEYYQILSILFIFLGALRIKYRINEHRYQEFYKNLVRKKLSDFLLEEERRYRLKAKRAQLRQESPKETNATDTEIRLPSLATASFSTSAVDSE